MDADPFRADAQLDSATVVHGACRLATRAAWWVTGRGDRPEASGGGLRRLVNGRRAHRSEVVWSLLKVHTLACDGRA